jgi:hypothetical protein
MRDSLDGSQKASLAVRDAPGAGLVLWAESAAGAMELERPYAHSTSLDGEGAAYALFGVRCHKCRHGASFGFCSGVLLSVVAPHSGGTASCGLVHQYCALRPVWFVYLSLPSR